LVCQVSNLQKSYFYQQHKSQKLASKQMIFTKNKTEAESILKKTKLR